MATLGDNVICLVREKSHETTKARELALVIQKLAKQYNQEIAAKKLSKNKKTTKNREQRKKRRERAARKLRDSEEGKGNLVGNSVIASNPAPGPDPAPPTSNPISVPSDSRNKSDIKLSNLSQQQGSATLPSKVLRKSVTVSATSERAPIVAESSNPLRVTASLPVIAVHNSVSFSAAQERPEKETRERQLRTVKKAPSQLLPSADKGKEPEKLSKKDSKASQWKSKAKSKAKGSTRRLPPAQTYFGMIQTSSESDEDSDRDGRGSDSSEYLEEDGSDVESEVGLSISKHDDPDGAIETVLTVDSKDSSKYEPNAIQVKSNSRSPKSFIVGTNSAGPPGNIATTKGKRK